MNNKNKRLWENTLDRIDDEIIGESAQTLYKRSLSDTNSDELIIVEEKKKSNNHIFAVVACIVALIGVVTLVSVILLNGGIETQPVDSTSSDVKNYPVAKRIWDRHHPDDADRTPYFSVKVPELNNAFIENRPNNKVYIDDEYLMGDSYTNCDSFYLSDLNGDGYPELCIGYSNRYSDKGKSIAVVDYIKGKTVHILPDEESDEFITDNQHLNNYYLYIRNDKLCVKETIASREEIRRTGTLAYDGTEILVCWDDEIDEDFDRNDSTESASPDSSCVETSTPETTTSQTDETEPPEEPLEELTENEQILKLLYDYGDFIFNISFKPGKDWNYDIVYEKDWIYVDRDTNEVISSPEEAQTTYRSFCKAKESWIKELRSMITENMEESFIEYHIRNNYLFIYQDEWYLKTNSGGRGYGLGQSELILKSYEKPDENTLVLDFVDIGYKEEWGTEEDLIHEGQVILKKSEKGYLIEKCDDLVAEWFVHYSKIKYESKFYYIDKNKVNDDITEVDDLDDGAIAAFKLFYGQEYREITDDEAELIYKRVFGDKLIDDESVQDRVNYLGKTMGAVETQLYNAAFDAEGLDPYNVTEDIKEKWFLSEDPPELFSSMEELYKIQKDVFSDITTYEDFLTKFDAFKYEDGKFYTKGRAAGHTRTLRYPLPFDTGGEKTWIPKYCKAVEVDGEIKMAVLRVYSKPTLSIYSVHLAPLTQVDGVIKFPRECDWEKAFGKSK